MSELIPEPEILNRPAHSVPRDQILQIQGLSRQALVASGVSEVDADRFVMMGDSDRYVGFYLNPNNEVGQRIRQGNLFRNPRIVTATISVGGGEKSLVGVLSCADNTSGGWLERWYKMLRTDPSKRYLWLNSLVVRPEYQQLGIASLMLATVLDTADKHQPLTAYPERADHTEWFIGWLSRLGFEETGSEYVDRYGRGAKDVEQVRMQAPSVSVVQQKLGQE